MTSLGTHIGSVQASIAIPAPIASRKPDSSNCPKAKALPAIPSIIPRQTPRYTNSLRGRRCLSTNNSPRMDIIHAAKIAHAPNMAQRERSANAKPKAAPTRQTKETHFSTRATACSPTILCRTPHSGHVPYLCLMWPSSEYPQFRQRERFLGSRRNPLSLLAH